jgi:hypothetical protein
MSQIFFRCLLFCSAALSLNAVLVLPLENTLVTSSSYETKQGSLEKISITELKFNHQVSKLENIQFSRLLNVDLIFKRVKLNDIFSSFINRLKLHQNAIFHHVEYQFRRNVLSPLNYSLEYLPLTLLK